MTDQTEIKAIAPATPIDGILKAVEAVRDDVNKSSADYQQKLENVQKDFDKYIQANEEIKTQLMESKKEQSKQQEVINALQTHVASNKNGKSVEEKSFDKDLAYIFEKKLTTPNSDIANLGMDKKYVEALGNVKVKVSEKGFAFPELKSITNYLATPKANEAEFEFSKKYLRTDVDDQGGFLVPPEFMLQILKRGTEWSPIRKYANVMQTYSNLMYVPTRNVLSQAYMEWEKAPSVNANSATQSQYTRNGIYMKRMGAKISVSHEMILYSPFDIQSLVANDVVESFAFKEGSLFVNGGGTSTAPNEVEGILSNPNTIAYNSTNNVLNADDVLNMQAQIKWEIYGQEEYSRMYILNKRTLLNLATLKTGQGQYLWLDTTLRMGLADKIGGENYVICPDMPEATTGLKPIVMGDLKRAYTIADRLALYMIRDDVTDPPNVIFSFFKYFGAKVVMPEALVVLKLA
jgi:HK97 family phage major capsid protein